MFGFFNAPTVNYSYVRPTIYRQRYIPIESYLLNSIKRAQEYERYRYLLQKAINDQQKQNGKEINNENEQPKENIDDKTIDKSGDQIYKEKVENKKDQIFKEKQTNIPFYYFESHSRFDGEKLVEERKEKKVDSDGKVHQTLKRRLGDQWYQTEQVKDKEGKETIKEAWHNVSEEDIDSFKQEWIKHIGYQNEEIENKKTDEKSEVKSNENEKLTNEQICDEKDEAQNDVENENKIDSQIEMQNSNESEENQNN